MVVRKMKEKCKDAARMRREKERAEFVELSKLLPLPSSTTNQLDKASIIRLTSSYLRMRSAFPEGLGENWGSLSVYRPNESQQTVIQADTSWRPSLKPQAQRHQAQHQQQIRELGSLILQTLDGFVFALQRDGKIMYISETASVHLGLPQIDLTGSSIFEYVHPSDHNDICDILALNEKDQIDLKLSEKKGLNFCEVKRSFCLRMKCILPKRNAGLLTGGYKAIHCYGYLKLKSNQRSSETKQTANTSHNSCTLPDLQAANQMNPVDVSESLKSMISSPVSSSLTPLAPSPSSKSSVSGSPTWESYALVAVGHSLLPTASTEIKLSRHSFMFRANLDMRLIYIEAPAINFLGFEQVEMIGKSLYQFLHVDDLSSFENSHRILLNKGQVVTRYYRLVKRDGGVIWVQSSATLVANTRSTPKPQHIVSICFVLGDDHHDKSAIYHSLDESKESVCNEPADIKLTQETCYDSTVIRSAPTSTLNPFDSFAREELHQGQQQSHVIMWPRQLSQIEIQQIDTQPNELNDLDRNVENIAWHVDYNLTHHHPMPVSDWISGPRDQQILQSCSSSVPMLTCNNRNNYPGFSTHEYIIQSSSAIDEQKINNYSYHVYSDYPRSGYINCNGLNEVHCYQQQFNVNGQPMSSM